MREFWLYVWQLPQNILGLVMLFIYRPERALSPEGIWYYRRYNFPSGISLGKYIIVERKAKNITCGEQMDVRHEYGHQIQSRKLGWLYFPVVGLWSFVRNTLKLYKKGHYYDSWPEDEADRLGGVSR